MTNLSELQLRDLIVLLGQEVRQGGKDLRTYRKHIEAHAPFPSMMQFEDVSGRKHWFGLKWWETDTGLLRLDETSSMAVRAASAALSGQSIESEFIRKWHDTKMSQLLVEAKGLITPGAPGFQTRVMPYMPHHYEISAQIKNMLVEKTEELLSHTDWPEWARDARLISDVNIMFVSKDIMKDVKGRLIKNQKLMDMANELEAQLGYEVIPALGRRAPDPYVQALLVADETAEYMSSFAGPIQSLRQNMDWDADISMAYAFPAETRNLASLAKQSLAFASHEGVTAADEWLGHHKYRQINEYFNRFGGQMNFDEIEKLLTKVNLKTLVHKDTGKTFADVNDIIYEISKRAGVFRKEFSAEKHLHPFVRGGPVQLLNPDEIFARLQQQHQSKLLIEQVGTVDNVINAYRNVIFRGQANRAKFETQTIRIMKAMYQMSIDAAKPDLMPFDHTLVLQLWEDMAMTGQDTAGRIIEVLDGSVDRKKAAAYLPEDLKKHLPELSKFFARMGGLKSMDRKGYRLMKANKSIGALDVYDILRRVHMLDTDQVGYIEQRLASQYTKALEKISTGMTVDLGAPGDKDLTKLFGLPLTTTRDAEQQEIRGFLKHMWTEGKTKDIGFGRYTWDKGTGQYVYQSIKTDIFIEDLLAKRLPGERSPFSEWTVKELVATLGPDITEPGSRIVHLPHALKGRSMTNMEWIRKSQTELTNIIYKHAKSFKLAGGEPLAFVTGGRSMLQNLTLEELSSTLLADHNRDSFNALTSSLKEYSNKYPGTLMHGGVNASLLEKGVGLFRGFRFDSAQSMALDVANHLNISTEMMISGRGKMHLRQWVRDRFTVLHLDDDLIDHIAKLSGGKFKWDALQADSEFGFLIAPENKMTSFGVTLSDKEARNVQTILSETKGNLAERQKRMIGAVKGFKSMQNVGMGAEGEAVRQFGESIDYVLSMNTDVPGKKSQLTALVPSDKMQVHIPYGPTGQWKAFLRRTKSPKEFLWYASAALTEKRGGTSKEGIDLYRALRTSMYRDNLVVNMAHAGTDIAKIEEGFRRAGAAVVASNKTREYKELGRYIFEGIGTYHTGYDVDKLGIMAAYQPESLPDTIQSMLMSDAKITATAAVDIASLIGPDISGASPPVGILKNLIESTEAADYEKLRYSKSPVVRVVDDLARELRQTHQEIFDLIMDENALISQTYDRIHIDVAPRPKVAFKSNIRSLVDDNILRDAMHNRGFLYMAGAVLGGFAILNAVDLTSMNDLAKKSEQRQVNAYQRDYYTKIGIDDPRIQGYDALSVDSDSQYMRYVMTGVGGHIGQSLARGAAVARHPKGVVTLYASREGSGYFKPLRRRASSLVDPPSPSFRPYQYNVSVNRTEYVNESALKNRLSEAL